jgi:isoleucyl-tRNA synthetase
VLTNGFVVDLDGKKLSKSRGKPPGLMELVDKYGADVVRLWVASEDAKEDVPFSTEIFGRVGDSYRLLRNSFRILLGNLADFDSAKDAVPPEKRPALDRYILAKLAALSRAVREAYEAYNFPAVYHGLNRFLSVELSAFYIDACKDRIYCDAENDPGRRSAQSTMHEILDTLVRLAAPVLAFTAEEAWETLTGKNKGSIHLQTFREVSPPPGWNAEEEVRWEKLLAVRAKVNEALEKERQAKRIGKSLEAEILVEGGKWKDGDSLLLQEICLVSRLEIKAGAGEVAVKVAPARATRCARCWKHEESVGQDKEHPELCERCARVVKETVA